MKNRGFATFGLLALLTAGAAFAQSGPQSGAVMQADIPFAFHVGNNILPAGQYDVHPQVVPGVLSIRCQNCKGQATITTSPVSAKETPEAGKLVFHRYSETYFLSEVWTPGKMTARRVGISEAEREMARNSSPTSPVEVALRYH